MTGPSAEPPDGPGERPDGPPGERPDGPPAERPNGVTGADPGLFGPDSVTWRIHPEPILGVAGLRALLLQALHPRLIAGITQNSDFRDRPWHRYERTIAYLGETVYGTTERAEAAGRRIRAIHARMRATDLRTDEIFRLDDPELLRWVHVTTVESMLDVAMRSGVPVSPEDADGYLHEQRRAAALVGLDPGSVPGSVAEVAAYYDRMQPALAITPEAAKTLVFLAAPPLPFGLGFTPARAAYTGVAALAVGMLPAWARKRYGLPGLTAAAPIASLAARMLRLSIAPVPARLTEHPERRAARHRLGLGPATVDLSRNGRGHAD
jgi:uncharacterized protein (DUF2236 family)